MDIECIKELIPHRAPFLFVDEVLEIEEGVRIKAAKTFGPELDFFRGHFPGYPIVPGVIITEALAQAGGVLINSSYKEEFQSKGIQGAYLMGLENVRFRKPVEPGDRLILSVSLVKKRSRVMQFKGEAHVGDSKVAEAEIMVSLY